MLCGFTSVRGLPSLSSPEIVAVDGTALSGFPFVARGWGVLVARKCIELDS